MLNIYLDETLRILSEETKDLAISMLDAAGHVIKWNKIAEGIIGYGADEIIGKHFSCLYSVEDRDVLKPADSLKKAEAEGRFEVEGWRYRKNGRRFWARVVVRALRDKDGNLLGFSKVTRDLTNRAEAEAENEGLASFPQLNPNPIFEVDANGKLIFCNGAMKEILKNAGCGDDVSPFLPKNISEILQAMQQKKALNYTQEIELNGLTYEERIYLAPQYETIRFFTTDITARKLAEAGLRESTEKYQAIVEAFDGLIYICSDDFRIEFMNENLIKRTGKNALGEFCYKALHDRDSVCPWCVNERVFAGETVRWEVQSPKDGRWYYVVNAPIRNADGSKSKQSMIMDITESKQAEEKLRQANLIVENSPAVLFRWRAAEGWLVEMVSRNITQFGYKTEEFLSGTVSYSSLVYHEDLARVVSEVEKYACLGEDRFQQEYRIVTKDGAVRWIDVRTVIERDADGIVTYYQGIIIDITERKLADQALHLNAERMETLLQLNQMADATMDEITKFAFEAAMRVTRSNLGYLAFVNEDETVLSMQLWSRDAMAECKVLAKPKLYPVETTGLCGEAVRQRRPIITKDYNVANPWEKGTPEGHVRLKRDMNVPVIVGGRVVLVAGVGNKAEDYTEADAIQLTLLMEGMWLLIERRLAEEAIHQSEEKFRTLFMSLNEGFYLSEVIYDGNGNPCDYRYLEVNPKFEQIMGIERDQIIGKRYKELMPIDTTQWLDNYFKVALSGEPCTYEFYSNEYRMHFETYAYQPAKDQVSVLIIDVTDRKLAEEALRESEEKFRVLAETAPAAITVYQGEHFVYVNPAAILLFGYQKAELLGMKFWEWAHPDDREMIMNRGMARQQGQQVPTQYEHRFVTRSGEEGWAIVSAGRIEYEGKPAGIATFVDITETKRAEQRMQAALAEKVILLKEVHHRVKNNLQTICSLLDLQSESIPDEQSRSYFRETQDRIRTMALVHERLYESKDFTSIDFGEYIRVLSAHLFDSYLVDPGRVKLQVDTRELSIGVDRAIPWGLIINELISNALKHAFPDNRSGEISIRMCLDEDDMISLTVADTGGGMPPGLDFKNTGTLGLQLVNMLTRQLNGQISIDGTTGTVFNIRARRS